MQQPIQRSSQSVLIQYSAYRIRVKGYLIRKIPFHGLNKQSFGSFIDHLSKYVSFVTLHLNSQRYLLFCGFVNDDHDPDLVENEKFETILSNLHHLIPPDLELVEMSGYELPVPPMDAVQTKNGYLYITARECSWYHQIIFKKLAIEGNISKLIQGILEITSASLTISINSIKTTPKYHLSISLTENSQSNLIQSKTTLMKFLTQIPNITGELTFPTSNNYNKNLFLLFCGLNRYSLDKTEILQICKNSPYFLPSIDPPTLRPIYPFIPNDSQTFPSKMDQNEKPTQDKRNNRYEDSLRTIIEKLHQYHWEIQQIKHITENSAKVYIKNLEVDSCLLFTADINQDTIKYAKEEYWEGKTLPQIILYKRMHIAKERLDDISIPILSVDDIITPS